MLDLRALVLFLVDSVVVAVHLAGVVQVLFLRACSEVSFVMIIGCPSCVAARNRPGYVVLVQRLRRVVRRVLHCVVLARVHRVAPRVRPVVLVLHLVVLLVARVLLELLPLLVVD